MANLFDTDNAPHIEPVEIIQGDRATWKRSDLPTDYPPASYDLKYVARSEGEEPSRKIEITATDDDGDFLITITSVISADYFVGRYQWSAYIERKSDNERLQVDSGVWYVRANKATDGSDRRAHCVKMIDLIETALEGAASNQQLDLLAYNLDVESSATRNPSRLLEFRTNYRRELLNLNRREAARKGKSHSGKIVTRFSK